MSNHRQRHLRLLELTKVVFFEEAHVMMQMNPAIQERGATHLYVDSKLWFYDVPSYLRFFTCFDLMLSLRVSYHEALLMPMSVSKEESKASDLLTCAAFMRSVVANQEQVVELR
ncbi:hypothetical protein PsorP6_000811 [Peronosclerospora sorghi]|uniref:Uncharacterized protein n=1 Tax=Peronosclerospora sorghi TaxID=230839 RepID=A0ACC0WW40_9STRA|nr:hypothetical protein PsorP6_000811 [Peronosclerospora sorghi]